MRLGNSAVANPVSSDLTFDQLQEGTFYEVTGKNEGDTLRCSYVGQVGYVVNIDGNKGERRFHTPESNCVLNVDKWDYRFKPSDQVELVLS